jgi:hypothetical protein
MELAKHNIERNNVHDIVGGTPIEYVNGLNIALCNSIPIVYGELA